jgi:hypothetical protein
MTSSLSSQSSPPTPISLIQKMQAIADVLVSGTQDATLALATLQATERGLRDLLPMLEYERLLAEDRSDWAMSDALHEAVQGCKQALNRIRAAILRKAVIGTDGQVLKELQAVRDRIATAGRVQLALQGFMSLTTFIRRMLV